MHIIYITRGARSGILAELIPGMRSWASLAPRFCTSAYLEGNPWPLGTTWYRAVSPGSAGLLWLRKLLITSLRIIDNVPEEPGPAFPGVIPWWRLRASEQIKLAPEIKFG